jgi:hypothetical protein
VCEMSAAYRPSRRDRVPKTPPKYSRPVHCKSEEKLARIMDERSTSAESSVRVEIRESAKRAYAIVTALRRRFECRTRPDVEAELVVIVKASNARRPQTGSSTTQLVFDSPALDASGHVRSHA